MHNFVPFFASFKENHNIKKRAHLYSNRLFVVPQSSIPLASCGGPKATTIRARLKILHKPKSPSIKIIFARYIPITVILK